jgi:diguanylate cyclase (GGDEF)-like protein
LGINANQEILNEQVAKIQKQEAMMVKKDQTIDTQKSWLIVNLVIISLFFALIYGLVRLNTLRKKANSELELLNSQLYEQATTDGMTGLFNRRHFLETTQTELLHQQRNQLQSIMLMIDIDLFKNVNDTHGHAAGDEVIKGIALILKKNSRKYDVVGRLGGEEFSMLLVDCNMAVATEISQRLCDDCANTTISVLDITLNVTVSIGLSQFSAEDTNIEQVISRADKALYQAKQNGRNRVVAYGTNWHNDENNSMV